MSAPDPAMPYEPPAEEGCFKVKIASANVLTMRPAEEDECRFSTRRIQLDDEFARRQVAFVGVQESRVRKAGARNGRNFTMIGTNADAKGSFGMELWVNHKFCPRGAEAIKVLVAEPRRLLARVATTLGLSLALFSMRLGSTPEPRSCRPGGKSPRKLLDRVPKAERVIMMVDANARVGSVQSSAVGPQCPDE